VISAGNWIFHLEEARRAAIDEWEIINERRVRAEIEYRRALAENDAEMDAFVNSFIRPNWSDVEINAAQLAALREQRREVKGH
jgi:hypothetical protein